MLHSSKHIDNRSLTNEQLAGGFMYDGWCNQVEQPRYFITTTNGPDGEGIKYKYVITA